ncbi:P-loop containing nucleoside triphosphate hydrolase protein [Panaeolus papilionaceus]|nr:P-loop containing nucleoside triphosphate hydrolase protein [Panaeolus papilionaceus]
MLLFWLPLYGDNDVRYGGYDAAERCAVAGGGEWADEWETGPLGNCERSGNEIRMCALRSVYSVGGSAGFIAAAHESNDTFQYVSHACTTARRPPHIPRHNLRIRSDTQQRLAVALRHHFLFFLSSRLTVEILLMFRISHTTDAQIPRRSPHGPLCPSHYPSPIPLLPKLASNPSTEISVAGVLPRNGVSAHRDVQAGCHEREEAYNTGNVVNKLSDGVVAYPAPEDEKGGRALSDISLSIKPNQLVVIVGTNGSGKSTLIRILSRLYDPTSGEVCIDGRLSSSYRVGDLHKATTILSQDNSLYPLTLAENIGIGFPERSSDMDFIRQAAEEGGAVDVIKKLEDGYETRLDPMQESFSVNLYNDKQHPLAKELEGLRKTIDVSGGEQQKLVAARAFMRFHSNLIKFVAVDEPSSALDAEAEL